MNLWTRWWRRDHMDGELDDELRAHFQLAIEDRIARGESPADAERNSRREFGNELLVREVTRGMWGWAAIERFGQDLKYAFRQIRRSPGFSAIAVLTLALGLAATTAVFSIVNGVLLEPLHYREPGRLYAAVNLPSPRAPSRGYWLLNARQFSEWRAHCRSCEDVALAGFAGLTLTGLGEPERIPALRVSYNFFRTLGVPPALGRDFRPEEELPGQSRVLILSDAIWRTRFSRDPAVLGRTLQINGLPFTVIGVMPPDLQLPVGSQWGPDEVNVNASPLIFFPLGQDVSRAEEDGTYNYVSAVRLKTAAAPAQAVAEFNASIADIVRRYHIGLRPALFPLRETVTRGARTGLWLLMGIVATVLLIVCVNVGNLMLVRTASRGREAGIRMALGSSRGELFRLVLTEALLLVAIGSALGVGLAYVALRVFLLTAPVDLPRIGDVRMDFRVLLFVIAAALVSALICGLVPAWRLSRTDPHGALKSGSANATDPGRKVRLREVLVGAEVALSTLLLVVGSLLLLSFYRVMTAPRGFEASRVITQDVSLTSFKYSREPDRIRFVDEALRRLDAIPGMRSVGVTNQLPLRGETWTCNLRDGGPPEQPAVGLANFRFVNPGYWQAMGIPLVRGRFLVPGDRVRAVAVLGEKAAQALWPGQNPLGQHVGGCGGEKAPPSLEVVGVVGDVRAGAEKQAPFTVYQPYWQTNNTRFFFVLRAEGEPLAVIGGVRAALRSLDPDLPFVPAKNMDEVLEESVAMRRFQMELAVAFATAGLLLAALGVYGVISFSVVRRTPEMGVRIALGARGAQIVGMVVRQGMRPVIAGLLAGLAGALAGGRLIASQLFGVTPSDPLALSAVAFLLLAVALCACWIPTRRATRIDPLRALRFE